MASNDDIQNVKTGNRDDAKARLISDGGGRVRRGRTGRSHNDMMASSSLIVDLPAIIALSRSRRRNGGREACDDLLGDDLLGRHGLDPAGGGILTHEEKMAVREFSGRAGGRYRGKGTDRSIIVGVVEVPFLVMRYNECEEEDPRLLRYMQQE
eukprot:CAMPEP_0181112386 /NCGR_PEP_ID=MMETSP1071-20121207/19789_1 /TAXON_ID=35127 /ORGANISM="Thalassiosira sp., Strain NH16" /LENGTH=152 /DNA_ID=CAMNT_0023196359 /DNA_START=324 /DNA_END=782 /DNA_ORIENTATION=-